MLNEKYKLKNGVLILKLGLGTWMIDNNSVSDVVINAINLGYRLIDTAEAYENEEGIGISLSKTDVPREELFITSKIRAEYKTYEEATKAIDESLKKLGLDYIDLMIIHSPEPWNEFRGDNHYYKENLEVWRALEEAYKDGKVKAIGVSNFLKEDLENIINNCEIVPMVNQILTHITNCDFELIDYCKEHEIVVMGYSPIGHGELLKNEKIINMASKYNVSPSRLCIRYVIELGLVAIPKTSKLEYLKDNANMNFTISDSDMEILNKMDKIDNYGEYSYFPVFSGK